MGREKLQNWTWVGAMNRGTDGRVGQASSLSAPNSQDACPTLWRSLAGCADGLRYSELQTATVRKGARPPRQRFYSARSKISLISSAVSAIGLAFMLLALEDFSASSTVCWPPMP